MKKEDLDNLVDSFVCDLIDEGIFVDREEFKLLIRLSNYTSRVVKSKLYDLNFTVDNKLFSINKDEKKILVDFSILLR